MSATSSTSPPRTLLWLLGAMLLLASAYFYQDPEWNGNSRLDLTRAVVEQGTFRIDAMLGQPDWATEDRAFYNGHYYTDKPIGSSLLALPFYFILYRLGMLPGLTLSSSLVKHILTTIVIGGAFTLSGLSMYLVAHEIIQKTWESLLPTLALSCGTMLWPYSVVYYGHVVAAALLILAFYLLFARREGGERISRSRLAWVGGAMALALITDNTSALIIAGLLLYTLYILRGQPLGGILKGSVFVAIGASMPLLLMLTYNLSVYGRPLASGYSYEVENRFQEGMSLGVMGIHLPSVMNTYRITLDPQIGLFWQSPILILGVLGILFTLAKPRYRVEGLLCLYSIGAMIAMTGGYYLWWGGSAFGPRLLIPALPFFIVPLAMLPRGVVWITVTLAAVSAGQMLIPLMGKVQPGNLVFRLHRGMFYINAAPFQGFSLLYNFGLPQIFRQYAAGNPSWTLGAAVGLPYALSLPALLAVESATTLAFYRVARAHDAMQGERLLPGERGAPLPPDGRTAYPGP